MLQTGLKKKRKEAKFCVMSEGNGEGKKKYDKYGFLLINGQFCMFIIGLLSFFFFFFFFISPSS